MFVNLISNGKVSEKVAKLVTDEISKKLGVLATVEPVTPLFQQVEGKSANCLSIAKVKFDIADVAIFVQKIFEINAEVLKAEGYALDFSAHISDPTGAYLVLESIK